MEEDLANITEIDEKTGEIRIRTKSPTIVKLDQEAISESDNLDDLLDLDTKLKPVSSSKRKCHKSNVSSGEDLEKTDEEKLFDFTCHVCRREFVKMRHLMDHCKTEHNCLAQVNCVCGKVLATWNRLLVHKRKHFPDRPNYE